jgi:hypothetical protein
MDAKYYIRSPAWDQRDIRLSAYLEKAEFLVLKSGYIA